MQADFWLERWRSGQIGFHQPIVSPLLEAHYASLAAAPDATVFVPLCGKSLDLIWLQQRCGQVIGVELAALAIEAFCAEQGVPARRRQLGPFDAYEAPGLRLLRGDFFALSEKLLGPVSIIIDRAALISWAPALRDTYAEHLSALTPSGARTLLITLEYQQSEFSGPPFAVMPEEVERLYGRTHRVDLLEREDVLGSEPRLRAHGVRSLHQTCYRLTRL